MIHNHETKLSSLAYRGFRKQIIPQTHTLSFPAPRFDIASLYTASDSPLQGAFVCVIGYKVLLKFSDLDLVRLVGLRERKRVCFGGNLFSKTPVPT